MKKQLQKLWQSKKSEYVDKPSKKSSYIIVIGLMGLLLLILGNVFSPTADEEEDPPLNNPPPESQDSEQPADEVVSNDSESTSDVDEIEASYEDNLKEMLNRIEGVSEADIMINLESTKVKVYEKDLMVGQQSTEENDTNGGTRQIEDNTEETQVVLVRQGDKEVPLLIQTKKPDVRGVFVVAKGVDHATVEQWVVEAVSRVLDVPTHRVSVMPKN